MRLTELDVDQVRIALKTHARLFNRLLERYFRSFTEYFSKNGYRADLLEMISICQDPTVEMQSNYVHIMDGLVQLGMLYWGALNLVLNYHTNFTEKSMFVLTTLITDKRNNNISQYLANLKNFYKMHFQFNPIIIDRLMQICLDMPYDAKWFEFVRKVVNDCSSMDGLNLDLLAGFCTMTPGKYDLIRKSRSNLNWGHYANGHNEPVRDRFPFSSTEIVLLCFFSHFFVFTNLHEMYLVPSSYYYLFIHHH